MEQEKLAKRCVGTIMASTFLLVLSLLIGLAMGVMLMEVLARQGWGGGTLVLVGGAVIIGALLLSARDGLRQAAELLRETIKVEEEKRGPEEQVNET
jgi:hypothetical protein